MTEAPANLIYGLIDPRTLLIRYVGQSARGLQRPKEHRHASCPDTYCRRWVRCLEELGLTYSIVILESVEDPKQLSEAERWWIAYGRALRWPLTNLTDGGCLSEEVLTEKRRRKAAALAERRRRQAAELAEQRRQKALVLAEHRYRLEVDARAEQEKLERRARRRARCFEFFAQYRGQRPVKLAAIKELKIAPEVVMEFHAEWWALKEAEQRAMKEREQHERAVKAREAYERGKRALEAERAARLAAANAAKVTCAAIHPHEEEERVARAREAYERGKRALAEEREARFAYFEAEKRKNLGAL